MKIAVKIEIFGGNCFDFCSRNSLIFYKIWINKICSKQSSKTYYISSGNKNWSRDFATFGRQNFHDLASPGLTLALALKLEQKFPSNDSPNFKI